MLRLKRFTLVHARTFKRNIKAKFINAICEVQVQYMIKKKHKIFNICQNENI